MKDISKSQNGLTHCLSSSCSAEQQPTNATRPWTQSVYCRLHTRYCLPHRLSYRRHVSRCTTRSVLVSARRVDEGGASIHGHPTAAGLDSGVGRQPVPPPPPPHARSPLAPLELGASRDGDGSGDGSDGDGGSGDGDGGCDGWQLT